MPAVVQTPAIVLNVMDYGESDKIITFYTLYHGKLKGIAKGAKRSKKRFVNKLEYFTCLDITAVPGRRTSLARIDQAELIDPYLALRENYQRYTAAMLVCELVDQWTRENDSDELLFQLVIWILAELSSAQSITDSILFFQVKMFDLVGVGLQLYNCLVCHKEIHDHTYRFSLAHNGLICPLCAKSTNSSLLPLSVATIKILQRVQALPLDKVSRLKFSSSSRKETVNLLKLYSQFQLQRDINSWKQLESALSHYEL